MTNFTSYKNGAIRNAAGKLVGFIDRETNILSIDGVVQQFTVVDDAHAMDLMNQYVK